MTQTSHQFPLSEAMGVEEVSFLSESDDSDFEVVEETFLWDSLGSEGSSGSSSPKRQDASVKDPVEASLSFVPEHGLDGGKPNTVNTNLNLDEKEIASCENLSPSNVAPEENLSEEVKGGIFEEKEGANTDSPLDTAQARLSSTDSLGLHASAFEENLRFTLENSTFESITFELPLTLRILFTGSGANGEDKEPILEKISHSLARLFEPSPATSQTMSSSSSLLGSRREFGINYVVLPMSVLLGRDDLRNSVVRYEDSGVYIQVGDFIGRSASDTLHYIQTLEASFLSCPPHARKNVVDVCFYFLSPFPNNDDVNEMVLVSRRVNVVPIIVGTEALNVDEIVECRRSILEMLEKNEVDIRSFTDSNILLTHGWLKNKGDICGETILTTTEFTLLDSQCVYNRILEFHVDAVQSATKRATFELKRKKRQSLRWFTALTFVFFLVLWILLPIPGLDLDIPDESEQGLMHEHSNTSEILNQTSSVPAALLLPQPSSSNSLSIIDKPSTDLTVHTSSLPNSGRRVDLHELSSTTSQAVASDTKAMDFAQTIRQTSTNVTEQLQPSQHLDVDPADAGIPVQEAHATQPTSPACLFPTASLTASSDFDETYDTKATGQDENTNIQGSQECNASPVHCILLRARKSLSIPIKGSAGYILQIRTKVRSTVFTALGDLVGLYIDFAQPRLDWYIEKVLHYRASIRQKLSTVKVSFGEGYIEKVDRLSEPLVSKVVEMRRAFRDRISNFKEKLLKTTRSG